MAVDWVLAAEIAGLGLFVVFVALALLAVGVSLSARVLRRIGAGKDVAEEKKEVS